MSVLGPELVPLVLAACQAGAAEIGASLSRALDAPLKVSGSVQANWAPEPALPGLDGPGLIVLLKLGTEAAVMLLPKASGVLPEWCSAPDATGAAKLATLAQELALLVLPESIAAEESKTVRVERLDESLRLGGLTGDAGLVAVELEADDGRKATAYVVWPATNPDAIAPGNQGEPAASTQPARPADPASGATGREKHLPSGQSIAQLPSYTRSLLRISVPVTVVLAVTRQPVQKILELGTGSIIQFQKSCDEMLDLCIGEEKIALGEAVKVGDKFGLRIIAFAPREERFVPLRATP